MHICVGLSSVQVHVAPSPLIIVHASVKVNNCCAKNILQQSFQLKKCHNKSVLPGYHTVLMQNNICNKYIQVAKLNYKLSYFLQFFNRNMVFCLKLAEQRYTESDRFLLVNAVMKG